VNHVGRLPSINERFIDTAESVLKEKRWGFARPSKRRVWGNKGGKRGKGGENEVPCQLPISSLNKKSDGKGLSKADQ